MTKLNERLFDKRTLDRHIDSGLVTKDQVEVYLSSITDSTENAEVISYDEDGEETEDNIENLEDESN